MWKELKIQVSSDNAPQLEQKLFAAGAVSVTYLDAKDQAIFVEKVNQIPMWENVFIVSLFQNV